MQGRLDLSRELSDGEVQALIDEEIMQKSREGYLMLEERLRLQKELFNSMRRLDMLQELIEDPEVTEIMVNGPENIFVERGGRLTRWEKSFSSKEKLEDVVQQIVSFCNRSVSKASPIADARLADGSRVNIVLDPVALNGPVITIRRFPKEPVRMRQLLEWGSISEEAAAFLRKVVKAGYNIFVSGGTGSGKTTVLNALSEFIPADERIITIEDNAELQLDRVENLVILEARNANLEGEREITIRDLIKTSTDMLSRLETMVLMGMDLPLTAVRRQIASGVDLIVHLGRLRDGSRKVLEIVELTGMEQGEICLRSLFHFEEEPGHEKAEKVAGQLRRTEELLHTEKLRAAGIREE